MFLPRSSQHCTFYLIARTTAWENSYCSGSLVTMDSKIWKDEKWRSFKDKGKALLFASTGHVGVLLSITELCFEATFKYYCNIQSRLRTLHYIRKTAHSLLYFTCVIIPTTATLTRTVIKLNTEFDLGQNTWLRLLETERSKVKVTQWSVRIMFGLNRLHY